MRRYLFLLLAPVLVFFIIYGYGQKPTGVSADEILELADIAGVSAVEFVDISKDVITKERAEKFRAVSGIARTESGLYGFIVRPIAYNGPVTLALVIDGESGRSLGMRILRHEETEHYVRDMEREWFTGRFLDKSVSDYLQVVRVEARSERDIVSITGATITTEGIVNGVNAAFGMFREYVSGEPSEAVPYMVRFEREAGDMPRETGSLVLRAFGLVMGEITLDEIRELPSVRRTMSIHSTVGATQHSYRGTLLSNVLDLFDPEITEDFKGIRAVGADGFVSHITMSEILMENNVYVMYEDNDEPLARLNGQPGAMRVVLLEDTFGERFTKHLLEIILD